METFSSSGFGGSIQGDGKCELQTRGRHVTVMILYSTCMFVAIYCAMGSFDGLKFRLYSNAIIRYFITLHYC